MASSSSKGKAKGVKNLQKISSNEVFRSLREDNNAAERFFSADDKQQHAIFQQVWLEYLRLYEMELKYRTYLKWCPAADRDLYTLDARKCLQNVAKISDDGVMSDDSGSGRGPLETNNFRSQWHYYQGLPNPVADEGEMLWEGYNLIVHDGPERKVELCECRELYDFQGSCVCPGPDPDPEPPVRSIPFSSVISSQLLQYRLAAVLTMPPEWGDLPDDNCWCAELFYAGQRGITKLTLEDNHGAANISYIGSSEGSESALALINYLISSRVPHPDHEKGYFLAGTEEIEPEVTT